MTTLDPDRVPFHVIQHWLQSVITHPDGVQAGMASSNAMTFLDVGPNDVERVILPSSQMSSLDRLGIYGRAYFARLLECLRAQYPAVQHAIGNEAFDGLAFGYLVEHPSKQYTLSSLGHSFDAYLAATRPPRSGESHANEPDFADFLIDLARLERIYGEVFDGPGPEQSRSLNVEDFQGLTPEGFAESRLQLHECVRLIELQFPVHEYATALRRWLDPTPQAARPVCLVITRRDYIVRRYEINRAQFMLLSAIKRQTTVGTALGELSATNTDFDLTEIQAWFREWSAAPLFTRLIRN